MDHDRAIVTWTVALLLAVITTAIVVIVVYAEGQGGGEGSGEAVVTDLAPGETFDETINGIRLVLSYDAEGNTFNGSVENTTDGT